MSPIIPFQQPDQEKDLQPGRTQALKDFIILGFIVVAVLLGVLNFETSIASWLERQGARVDAVIVVAFTLALGLAVFSARRWQESRVQVNSYKQLHAKMNRMSRETALLEELADSLQSCLTTG